MRCESPSVGTSLSWEVNTFAKDKEENVSAVVSELLCNGIHLGVVTAVTICSAYRGIQPKERTVSSEV